MSPSLLHSLLTQSCQTICTFPGKGHEKQICSCCGDKPSLQQCRFTSHSGRAVPKPLGLLEESLHVLRRIHKHEDDFTGGSPASQCLMSLSYAACSSSPLVRTTITSTACYEECVCDHTTRKRQFGMLLFRQHCVNSGNWTMG